MPDLDEEVEDVETIDEDLSDEGLEDDVETEDEEGSGSEDPEDLESIDPNQLPEELRGSYNSMLRDYRKKTAALADERKKAALWDRLQSDQNFQRQVVGALSSVLPQAAQAAEEEADELDAVDISNIGKEDLNVLRRVIRDTIEERYAPAIRSLQEDYGRTRSRGLMESWDSIVAEHDGADVESALPAVSDLLKKNPGFMQDQPDKERLRRALYAVRPEVAMAKGSPNGQPKNGTRADKVRSPLAKKAVGRGRVVPKADKELSVHELIRDERRRQAARR